MFTLGAWSCGWLASVSQWFRKMEEQEAADFEKGKWVAVWDRAEQKDSVVEPGWRIAWYHEGTEFVWKGITFGRKKDADRAVEAMYSLSEWNCGDSEDCRRVALGITQDKIQKTIMEWMAW